MNTKPSPSCQSFFRNAEKALTPEHYTKIWIQLIQQLEKSEDTVAVH